MAIQAKETKDIIGNGNTATVKVSDSVVKSTTRKAKESKASKVVNLPMDIGLTLLTKDSEDAQVFNLPVNSALLTQYIRVYQFNQRQGNAKTKTRGEVAGSGKKPWKQKGTGRSRVGSVRNPVWRHGGISHGPVVKDWSLKLSKNMKSAAFSTALSQKISNSQVYLVDKLDLQEGRTKELVKLMSAWKLRGTVLFVLGNINPHVLSALANLPKIQGAVGTNVNAYQLMANKYVVFEKSALVQLKDKYAKNN